MSIAKTFKQEGVVAIAEPVIPASLVSRAYDAAYEVRSGSYQTGVAPTGIVGCGQNELCKINDAHLSDPAIYELVSSPEIGKAAADATGARRVQVWATQLLIKPPVTSHAANVGWHQDYQYWQYWDTNEGLFTVWVALSDVREESGAVRFVVGSHEWGYLDSGDFFATDNTALKGSIPLPEGQEWTELAAVLRPGGVSIHNSLTYHGSGPNTSEKDRVSVAIHMRSENPKKAEGADNFYVSHLNNPDYCPVIFGE